MKQKQSWAEQRPRWRVGFQRRRAALAFLFQTSHAIADILVGDCDESPDQKRVDQPDHDRV